MIVDARGLACPMPVIRTKKALESIDNGMVETVVDNDIARENVEKLAKSMSYLYDTKKVGSDYHVSIFKAEGIDAADAIMASEAIPAPKSPINDFVILVTKDKLGTGSDELGEVLIKGYFYTLSETKPYPKAVFFVNSAVNLTTEGSPVLESLRVLEAEGVEITSCGTCLDYFNLKEKLMVGGVGNMYSIVESTSSAFNTITI